MALKHVTFLGLLSALERALQSKQMFLSFLFFFFLNFFFISLGRVSKKKLGVDEVGGGAKITVFFANIAKRELLCLFYS